jgi:TRAP-type mannitol/chloroaromatic compound transport system substrate-binding protein
MIVRRLSTAALGLALACATAALGAGLHAQERVRWKMHAAFPSKMQVLGTNGVRVAETVTNLSGGSLTLRHYEPNALVPAYNYIDALGQGSLEAAYGVAGVHVAKNPALAFFAAVPFGPNPGEFLAWLKHGGGLPLMDELYAKLNVKGLVCGMLPPEASGWFRQEVKSLDDLKGKKIRFFGYGGKVLEKFGVSPQLLASGDIYPALELGTIDATEFSIPSADESLGLHQVAKHYYFPGWHQLATLQELEMHRPAYEALSKEHKMLLDVVCGYAIAESYADGEATQFAAMHRIQQKGVTLHRWPPEMLKAFEDAWVEVIEAEAAKQPDVKKIWASLSDFRKKYAIWGDMGYMR